MARRHVVRDTSPVAPSRVEFLVLGPLDVRVDGVSVRVGGPKQRALLALLLLSANRVVSRERLIRELQGAQDVEAPDHVLRVQVWRLRKTLASDGAEAPRLVSRAPGYLLRVEPGELDLDLFEHEVAAGRAALAASDPARAAALLRNAESLWRGRPLADLEFEQFARIDAERLEELRLAAVEARVDADLALGRHATLVPELEAAIADHPLRERLRAQLMLALYRCGRQAEGLAVYRRTRSHLNAELGLEPGVALRQLEKAILLQDPSLDVPPDSGADWQVRGDATRMVCPFKGLAAFEAADADYFFGRERLVGELVGRLADSSMLVVAGPSGSGKSSLLRAGLLPALIADELPGDARRRHVLMRPGPHPATELARALPGGLADAVAKLRPGERLVVAVDQFEEVFTVCGDDRERRAFVEALVEAAWDPDRRCAVLLTLRGDFFGRLAEVPDLAELAGANHVLLGPMSGQELRRAIEGPAERAGLLVEPGLVEALVADVAGQAGVLPLLSTALVHLWQERQGRSLVLEAYQRMGRVQGAVARHAEAAYGRLSEEQQEIARRLLLRLATGSDSEAVTRRRVALAELDLEHDDGMARVLATLTDSRLLTTDDGGVEVAHEALLHEWPRFREWLAEDAEGRRLHRHLTQTAADWDAGDGDAGELYRGARLSAALEWADAGDHALALNALEREFLDQSRAASVRESERQRRVNRRLRVLLGGALALLVSALAAGAIALQQRHQARQQATAAIAGRLGAQALIEPGLDRSLLLAREGVQLDDSLATRGNLLASLLRSPAALAVLHGQGDRALDEALTPDGRTLAVGGDDGSVVFFDTRTRRRIGSIIAGDSQISMNGAIVKPIHALAFSPDGRTLAIGSTTGWFATLSLVDARTHRERTSETSRTTMTTTDVVFAADGRRFVTGEAVSLSGASPDEVIVLRDATNGHELTRSLPIRGGRVAGFTKDGRSVLVTSGARSQLLDARTLKPLKIFATGGVAAVAPTGNTAALGGDDGTVSLVDLATGKLRQLSGQAGGRIQALSFSADGTVLASADADGSVAVWHLAAARLGETFQGHSTSASGVALNPAGTTLYSTSSDGSIIVWDVTGERRLGHRFGFSPAGRAAAVVTAGSDRTSFAVAVSPDGSLFATSPAPGRVTLWHARTVAPDQRELRDSRRGAVTSLSFSHDGRLLAAADNSSGTTIWNVTTGRPTQTFRGIDPGSAAVAFSPDDATLATAGLRGNLALYSVPTGAVLARMTAGPNSLTDIDFSPDGTLIAVANLANDIFVWNIARRALVQTIAGQVPVYTLRFSPDGRSLAAGDHAGNVVFWDVSSGRSIGRPLGGHNGPVLSVSFGPRGTTLLTVAGDGNLRLWDVKSRTLIGTPIPGSDAFGSGLFFPDGTHVISVFESGVGVIWNVDPTAWKARACKVAHRNLTRTEWRRYLADQTFRKVCA
ncbi:MAG: hypothetical protein QOI71_751 [Gaiellales bacterium]|nr:hypothetical protein [Gaiellales bacterium]